MIEGILIKINDNCFKKSFFKKILSIFFKKYRIKKYIIKDN